MELPAGYWILAGIGVLADLRPLTGYGAGRATTVYLSTCTSFAILLVWGAGPALAAQAAASIVAALRSRSGLGPRVALIARTAAALGTAAVVLELVGLGTLRRSEGIDGSVLVDLFAAVVAWLLAYYGSVVAVDRARHRPWSAAFNRGLRTDLLGSASLLFLAPVVVAEPRGWTFALLALPALALNQMTWLVDRQGASLRQDQLTGLLNQRGLAEVAAELAESRFALVVVRMKRLRDVADSFGGLIVDAVLIRVAGRLQIAARDRMVVARADSDDFMVLVPRTGNGESDPVGPAVETISRSLEAPAMVGNVPFDISGTVVSAYAPEDGRDLPDLLRVADAAVRRARVGPPVIAAPSASTPPEGLADRLHLLTDLASAIGGDPRSGRIEFVYQPQVRLDSEKVIAVEALLRWTHPGRGPVNPDELLLVAEPTPLMQALTELAVDTVTAQLGRWNECGLRLRAAVNVSVRDLQQDRVVEWIVECVARRRIPAEQLVIEITEGEVIQDPHRVRRATQRLAAAGIRIALDDFGTGFASLQHLRLLGFDELKIDKGLVSRIADDPDDRAIVRSVIQLAQALRLTVIAEGVENKAVHGILRDLGCPVGQGWLFGRPATGDQIAQRLAGA